MAGKTYTSIDVEILGATYQVRGEKDGTYLQELAEIVDRKMREIGNRVTTVDTGKIAILAALNLADELVQRAKDEEGVRIEIRDKVVKLTGALSDAINA